MELELIKIFVKVVQNGSFSKAAISLKQPKSTVSKAVSRLERETGTKLLVRTTRSLSLTAPGRAFFEACLGPIHQLEDAQKSLYGQDSILTGVVKITAPEDLGEAVIAPVIARLAIAHPQLRFDLVYTDDVIDLVKDGFDLAVRLGRVNESSFKLKRAGEVVLVPVASPEYLKGKAKIKTPSDLKDHVCLSISAPSYRERWTLRSGRVTTHVAISPAVMGNQMTTIMKMAIAGAGVALVPKFLCRPHLDRRELIHVLPEWASPGLPVSIITPLAASSSARLKITTDQIAASLATALSKA